MSERPSGTHPPEQLKSKHRIIAALDAAGYSNVDIATQLDLSANWVSTVKRSPLYQALLETERARLRESCKDLFQLVAAQAERALERKIELMEQDTNLAVANSACDSILDRVLPKKQVTSTDFQVKITLEEKARIDAIIEEMKLIDVTPLDGVEAARIPPAEPDDGPA